VLVACSHGTASPEGRRAVTQLRARLAGLRPGLEIAEAYVDVEQPEVAEVVRDLVARGRRCVVVPLLLSSGYHVRVDVTGAVAGTDGLAVAARPLGPDPVLVDALLDRLTETGAGPCDTVLLAAAGSGDPRAAGDVEGVAAALTERLGRPVTPCYLSAGAPTVSEAVSAALAGSRIGGDSAPGEPGRPGDVVVAAYLLSPGFFADRLTDLATRAGAGRVTAPLAGHPALAELVLRRYDDARTQQPPPPCRT
jgi:sirohydrochlorin ferrochelatase